MARSQTKCFKKSTNKKSIFSLSVAVLFCLSYILTTAFFNNAYASENTETLVTLHINDPIINVNGIEKEIDPDKRIVPIIVNNRTLIPIRTIIENLGGTVGWVNSEKKATIKYFGKQIDLWINRNKFLVNGVEKIMDVPPKIYNGRTYIPLRAVLESLGMEVKWYPSQKIEITVPKSNNDATITPSQDLNVYEVELTRWNIYNNRTNAEATTNNLNKAIEWAASQGYTKIKIPSGNYLIGKKTSDIHTDGLHLKSNIELIMDKNTVLQMVTNNTWSYTMIDINNSQNIKITGGTLIGDRQTHDYNNGMTNEDGALIVIEYNSKNIEINGVSLSQATGDGITILGQCDNIKIRNSNIGYNRRQGISVVGATNVLIEGNEIHNIEGTAPQFGIDIESLNYKSKDITIRNNYFHDNKGGDIVNCDGLNVIIQNNTLDQGQDKFQTDGPIVFWKETNNTIKNNTITIAKGSNNGKIGIIGYSSDGTRANPNPNIIDSNHIINGGMVFYKTNNLVIENNVCQGYLALDNITNLTLNNNDVTDGWRPYLIRNTTGSAEGNIKNGNPVEIPLNLKTPYTNYSDGW